MNFDELKQLLSQTLEDQNLQVLEVPTLGGNMDKKVKFSIEKDNLKIINAGENSKLINKEIFDAIWNRFQELDQDDKFIHGSYAYKNWTKDQGNPNMIFSPYLPALFKYFKL